MRVTNRWIALSLLTVLGGCFFQYDYAPTGGGGMGGGSVDASSASGAGSLGGNGGTGGGSTGTSPSEFVPGETTATPVCKHVFCDSRPSGCLEKDCFGVKWARRAGNLDHEQRAAGIAIFEGAQPVVAIAGTYVDSSFELSGSSNSVKLPDASPSDPTDAFKEGFVGLYALETGAPSWATNLGNPTNENKVRPVPIAGDSREARSVAFDSTGNVIVGGYEDPPGGTRRLILQKYVPTAAESLVWSKATLGSVTSRTEIIAISIAADSIFVLGRALKSAEVTGCKDNLGNPVHLQSGPFVAKLDGGGNCSWLKTMESTDGVDYDLAVPTAIHADLSAVWITGTFTGMLDVTPIASFTATAASQAFAIELSLNDGSIQTAFRFEGPEKSATPLGITKNPNGHILLVGEAEGSSTLALGLEGKGAFVTDIERKGPSTFLVSPYTFPVTGVGVPGAKATSIAINQGLAFVTGLFAGTLTVGPPGAGASEVTSTDIGGNATPVPFLAVFKPNASSAPDLLSFDAFPSTSTAYNSSFVVLAQSANYVALGGAWSQDLNFTTQNPQSSVSLPPSSSSKVDAFAALFKLP